MVDFQITFVIRISEFVIGSLLDDAAKIVRLWARLAKEPLGAVANELFAAVAQTPAVQSLQRRLEKGGALSCAGVTESAQPFLAALLRYFFPQRPLVVVTAILKVQESFQQDITTWLHCSAHGTSPNENAQPSTLNAQPLFYPAWETLPHEAKLPHADVISERLETLVALARDGTSNTQHAPLVVASVEALQQRTFPPHELKQRTRALVRGDRLDPLDLVEWLEEQGYEPEAQVTQKGETTLRGGILDVYPSTSPWPVRLEFFGDELESLRYFDPLTQISREEISSVTLPPAGELGILKRRVESKTVAADFDLPDSGSDSWRHPKYANSTSDAPAILADYLPPKTLFLLCEPEALAERGDQYAQQTPTDDPFFVSWKEFQHRLAQQGMTSLEVCGAEIPASEPDLSDANAASSDSEQPGTSDPLPVLLPFSSLDAFRPLGDRAPEPQIAETQRREFFAQLHRWLRQDYDVHVFCNNEGERRRFDEIWAEHGFDKATRASGLPHLFRTEDSLSKKQTREDRVAEN
ncbi:MAG TPA: hypothetical protein VKA81_04285, partial [Verrucomicrobiae bacterium]|nr:hypothetical protein [Verrucomicrobiae bacterium]